MQMVYSKVPSRDRSREMEWLEENRAKYADQWVVVEGDRLIAADADGHKAFAAAKASGIDVPLPDTRASRRSATFRSVLAVRDAPIAQLRCVTSLPIHGWNGGSNRASCW